MMARALADIIVAVHVAYVAFVALGQLLILIGIVFGWRWIRNPWFRIAHLVAILIVAGEAVLQLPCPLTIWEANLRIAAGQEVTGGSFIGQLLHNLIFFDGPEWVFDASYIGFAILVLITFWLAPPVWKREPSRRRFAGPGQAAKPIRSRSLS